ncbi:MAG: hypothetical protein V4648_08615 [Bacteroidota bacterium]
MALDRIEKLIENYFEGETSSAEENELKVYFSSPDVAQHLEQYKPIFGYFSQAKAQQYTATIPLKAKKRNNVAWLSIAASVVVLFGIGTFMYTNEKQVVSDDLGTYDDPEIALAETQKALTLVSQKINVGIGSVGYINEYEQSKNRIFKKQH